MSAYAGIGSRETPSDVIEVFEELGFWLANRGYVLRSGHADGADSAFERGCEKAKGEMEIFLPWSGFNGSTSKYILRVADDAMRIAQQYHPFFNKLSQGAQKLQSRNSYQVLGYHLDDPVLFVVCWTKKGMGSGGTGQAIRIAESYKIPVFDFGKFKQLQDGKTAFMAFYGTLLKRGENT